MSNHELQKLVEDAGTRLIEHFDSVQIIATFHSEDGDTTKSISVGFGNLYARHGSVREWLIEQDQYVREDCG